MPELWLGFSFGVGYAVVGLVALLVTEDVAPWFVRTTSMVLDAALLVLQWALWPAFVLAWCVYAWWVHRQHPARRHW